MLGLDIHFEMVPTPAPVPLPIPNPFIGLVFDPLGLAAGIAIGAAIGCEALTSAQQHQGTMTMNHAENAPARFELRDDAGVVLGELVELELLGTRRLRIEGQEVTHYSYRGRLLPTAAWEGSEARRLVRESDAMANDGAFAVYEELQAELRSKFFLSDRVPRAFVALGQDELGMMRLTTDYPVHRTDDAPSLEEVPVKTTATNPRTHLTEHLE